jgi:hypothetical protein
VTPKVSPRGKRQRQLGGSDSISARGGDTGGISDGDSVVVSVSISDGDSDSVAVSDGDTVSVIGAVVDGVAEDGSDDESVADGVDVVVRACGQVLDNANGQAGRAI